uniref:Lysine-specific demethylase n=1 Tax=Pelusios castaneus TaxID=367368 RepID=A0A8C8S633_9SAUR
APLPDRVQPWLLTKSEVGKVKQDGENEMDLMYMEPTQKGAEPVGCTELAPPTDPTLPNNHGQIGQPLFCEKHKVAESLWSSRLLVLDYPLSKAPARPSEFKDISLMYQSLKPGSPAVLQDSSGSQLTDISQPPILSKAELPSRMELPAQALPQRPTCECSSWDSRPRCCKRCQGASCDGVNNFGARNEMAGLYQEVDGALGGHGSQKDKVSALLACPPSSHHTKLKKTWLTRHSEQFRYPASCLGEKEAPGQIKEGLPLRFKALKRDGQEPTEEADGSGKRTAKRTHSHRVILARVSVAGVQPYALSSGLLSCNGEDAGEQKEKRYLQSVPCMALPDCIERCCACASKDRSGSVSPEQAGKEEEEPVETLCSLSLAKYLLSVLGDQFCEAIRRDKEAWPWAQGENDGKCGTMVLGTPLGRGDACDACQHGLFNAHWSCSSCGFQLCSVCYRTKRERANPGSSSGSQTVQELGQQQRVRWVGQFVWLQMVHALCLEEQGLLCQLWPCCLPLLLCPCGTPSSVMHLSNSSPLLHLESPDSVHPPSEQDPKGTVQTSTLCELLTSTAVRLCLGQNGVHMAFAPVSPALTSDNRITNILDRIIAQVVERKIQERHAECELRSPSPPEPQVSHCLLAPGGLLWLHDPNHSRNYKLFQEHWRQGQPVLVSGLQKTLKRNLWEPELFRYEQREQEVQAVNLRSQPGQTRISSKDFWDGFASSASKRLRVCWRVSIEEGLLQIFASSLSCRAENLYASLPLLEYCGHDGKLNLASYLPGSQSRQWLSPQICAAYGVAPKGRTIGTKNLTVEATDSISVLMYVGTRLLDWESAQKDFCNAGCRLRPAKFISCQLHLFPWQVCKAQEQDGAVQLDLNSQGSCYLDPSLRRRLREECGVSSWTLLQFLGDAVLVPAGAPHQVQSLSSTISITQRFLSPENAARAAQLAAQATDPASTAQRLHAQVRDYPLPHQSHPISGGSCCHDGCLAQLDGVRESSVGCQLLRCPKLSRIPPGQHLNGRSPKETGCW